MRYLFPIFTASLLFFGVALAKPVKQKQAVQRKSIPRMQTMNKPKKINLYAKPSFASKIVAEVDPAQALAPFFTKNKAWTKVGLVQDGRVGWVNTGQYKKVMRDFYRSESKTITINIEDNGKPGKTKIIAYRNGKKLSEKEARALYHKMQLRQRRFDRGMQRMMHRSMQEMREMNRMMNRQFTDMDQFFMLRNYPN